MPGNGVLKPVRPDPSSILQMAARPGFEPGLGESKSPVLPLHHQAKIGTEERAAPTLTRSRAESSPFALGS
jgi:hypothetical protein